MRVAKALKDDERAVLDLMDGTKIESLTPSSEDAYGVIRGAIPPGVTVLLHSHADAESFYVQSEEAEALGADRRRTVMASTPGRRLPARSWRN